MVHQRIGTVDQQQIDLFNPHRRQRKINGRRDMRACGVVIFAFGIRIAAHRGHDIAFGYDLHLRAQGRVCL